MKKISLKNLNLKEVDQLSREQLKNVLGGYTGETGNDGLTTTKKCSGSCTKTIDGIERAGSLWPTAYGTCICVVVDI